MKKRYTDIQLSDEESDTLASIELLIEEYNDHGITLSPRQIYYQFVERGLVPNETEWCRHVEQVVATGRMLGRLDWDHIADRPLAVRAHHQFADPLDALTQLVENYAASLWDEQRWKIEVWVEKDAMVSVVGPLCYEYHIPFYTCAEIVSLSEQRRAGDRARRIRNRNEKALMIHFGDYNEEMYARAERNMQRTLRFSGGAPIEMRRIALTWDQVEEFKLPVDPRSDRHNVNYEIEALDPVILDRNFRELVSDLIDEDAWDRALQCEAQGRREVEAMIDCYYGDSGRRSAGSR